MQKLSYELSRINPINIRHTGLCAIKNAKFFPENPGVKLNTRSGNRGKRIAASSSRLRQRKVVLTEFFASAKEICERRWLLCDAQMEGQLMLLNINEVARDYLGVSRSTVYRLIEQGELRSVKVRGCTRVSEQEISLFIESNGASR